MRMFTVLAAPALFLLAGSASAQTCQAQLNALADAGATGSAPVMAAAPAAQAEASRGTGASTEAGGESGMEPTDTPEGLATSVMPGADASVENDVEEPDAATTPAQASAPEEAAEAVSPAAAEDDAASKASLLRAQAQAALDGGDEQACLSKVREATALAEQ